MKKWMPWILVIIFAAWVASTLPQKPETRFQTREFGQLPVLLNGRNGRLTPASQRVSSLPPGIDAVIAKALSPEADQRYRTPGEFITALDGLATTVRAA